MRLVRPSLNACDRAREQISLSLDGELPELDRARLDAHLRRCEGCRMYRADLASATSLLRDASLEPAPFTISMPRRSFASVRVLQAAAAAAAVALVAGLGTMGGLVARDASGPGLRLGQHVRDRGDELVPGRVHLGTRPKRIGDRIAL